MTQSPHIQSREPRHAIFNEESFLFGGDVNERLPLRNGVVAFNSIRKPSSTTQFFGVRSGSSPILFEEHRTRAVTGSTYQINFETSQSRGLTKIRVNTIDPRTWVAFSEIEVFVGQIRDEIRLIASPRGGSHRVKR
jgi:hypothetical protein